MTTDLSLLSAAEATRLFATRALSPVEVTRATLAAIERYNPVLNAFCWLDPDGALLAAAESEARWLRGAPKGPLDGVTFTVKDLSMTRGWPTRRGCRAIAAKGPWTVDAPSVARMREAGAVPIGKTTVPEFGATGSTRSDLCGTTRNPWDPTKTPGGSSGGSSASVAAGMGTIALASDAAGSIRSPASVTGTFGLKTTFGRVPDFPSSYLGPLAVIGPITRSVDDARLCMQAIARPDPRDSYALGPTDAFDAPFAGDLSGLRIAYSPDLGYARVDPHVAALVGEAAKRFELLGARVETVGALFEDPSETLYTIMLPGLANAFRQFGFTSEQEETIHPKLLGYVEAGRRIGLLDYLAARERREALGAVMRAFHEQYDLLLTPTLSIPAIGAEEDDPSDPRYADIGDWKPFIAPFNLTKQPAASVPVGLTADGLPVGLQVVGPLYGDRRVLDACAAYERAFPFARPELDRLARATPDDAIPGGLRSMAEALHELASA